MRLMSSREISATLLMALENVNVSMCSSFYKQILFEFGMIVDTTELYSLLQV